jgi:hemoglobin
MCSFEASSVVSFHRCCFVNNAHIPNTMKSDISNRQDIELLVDTFYNKIQKDAYIGPYFTDVAKVDWSKHLPKMYEFWASILLGEGSYRGHPMSKHLGVDRRREIHRPHFEHWMLMWRDTVYGLFRGPKADEAIQRAENIAVLTVFKINRQHDGDIQDLT